MTASDRGRLIWKIGDLILENVEELAELESLDNGKPIGVARAADVPLAADLFHYMAGWATKITGDTFPISVPYAPGAFPRIHGEAARRGRRAGWPPAARSCSSPPSRSRSPRAASAS